MVVSFNQVYKGPIIKRHYPIPHHSKSVVEDWIKKKFKLGHIRGLLKASSWNSPMIVPTKKDVTLQIKGYRACIDPRHINLVLENNSFPLSLIKEIIESLKGMSKYILTT